jgi:hypothetical protein
VITKFRVWVITGQRPDWDSLRVLAVEPNGADSWTVVVDGDGRDFEQYVKTRRDLFTLYEWAPPTRNNH